MKLDLRGSHLSLSMHGGCDDVIWRHIYLSDCGKLLLLFVVDDGQPVYLSLSRVDCV